LGTLINKNNETQMQTITTPPTTSANPIVIQMPSFQYPYSFNHSDAPASSVTNLELPTIGDFLFSLDQKYNCNAYSNFESAFLEEEITVNAIKDLSDEQMEKLGIRKIGWQKNIRQAAQRY
jgi:SAM domain (Sterile alpha motif)